MRNSKSFTKSLPSLEAIRAEINRRQRIKCEADHLEFTKASFRARNGFEWRENWHHVLVCDTIDRVFRGELQNVVINMPPGGSKTEMASINVIARGLAKYPRARFLHLSYSDDLATLNSSTAREIVTSDWFQSKWPLKIAPDAKAKARWNVVIDGQPAGGVYATALGGQITGFRAGHMVEGFSGAILIDDPLKVEDAYSKTRRDAANRKLVSTVKSRRANSKTPIIVIMQRVAEEDPTGFIKAGKLGLEWEFITIPALIDDAFVETLPEKYRSMIDRSVRADDGRFSYWEYKEPVADLIEMEHGGKGADGEPMSRYVFSGQYQQNPTPLGGDIIKSGGFIRYVVPAQIVYRAIYADTAQKTGERNDYTVFQCWGLGDDGKIYLLDQIRDKWKATELKNHAVDFWNKHEADDSSPLRIMKVEDKSSGTGLVQSIQSEGGIPIDGIERTKDKLTRVMDVVAWIDSGHVCIPEGAPWLSDFITECEAFTPDDTHKHDDQIDPMCDAINDMLVHGLTMYDVN